MTHLKQLRALTLQVILSLIFLNTQISFAQNQSKWNEGPYVGVSLVFNKIKQGDASYINEGDTTTVINYNSDRERSKGIKIGYNKMISDSFFVGPEFFYSGEKNLDFNDSNALGVIDNIQFLNNYNVGLKAGYAVSSDIAYVIGYGKSYQKVETSFVFDIVPPENRGNKISNLQGIYRNFGILFNLGSGYNLEFLHQINSIDAQIHKDAVPMQRVFYDITIRDVKSTSVTISKYF
jgi:hypothetical protein